MDTNAQERAFNKLEAVAHTSAAIISKHKELEQSLIELVYTVAFELQREVDSKVTMQGCHWIRSFHIDDYRSLMREYSNNKDSGTFKFKDRTLVTEWVKGWLARYTFLDNNWRRRTEFEYVKPWRVRPERPKVY